jgi:hypothetical protein
MHSVRQRRFAADEARDDYDYCCNDLFDSLNDQCIITFESNGVKWVVVVVRAGGVFSPGSVGSGRTSGSEPEDTVV